MFQGIPRITRHSNWLPLTMFYSLKAPSKNASIKLTFNIDFDKNDAVLSDGFSLKQIFPEFNLDLNEIDDTEEAIGFVRTTSIGLSEVSEQKTLNFPQKDDIVSVIFSKKSNRLR